MSLALSPLAILLVRSSSALRPFLSFLEDCRSSYALHMNTGILLQCLSIIAGARLPKFSA